MKAYAVTQVRPALRSDRLRRVVAFVGEVAHRPGGGFGLAIVGLLVIAAVVPGLIAPHDPYTIEAGARLQGPSLSHPLGTDELGRDLLSRLIFGVRVELTVALAAVSIAAVVGFILGSLAGYVSGAGGKLDNAILLLLDTAKAFPPVILALGVLAVLGPSIRNLIVVIALANFPNYARVTRALILRIKEQPFIEAERALGARTPRVVLRHLLPNVLTPFFVLFAFDIPGAIVIEAGFSFLGLGIAPPTPSWGTTLLTGFEQVNASPWPIVFASSALVLTTIGFTLLGESLRDVTDPKMATGRRIPGLDRRPQ
jgi:peptide/nickel transport system permease protein